MSQLTGLDAAFLALETPNSTGHVGGVMILDPAQAEQPLTLERFIEAIGPRINLVPRCRRKLLGVPLGLDNPYWIEDEDFDIEYHVRELALPQPGSPKQLTEQVARLHARPLDRTRPLWEMYLITGLAGGRAAVYSKIHHAMIDGVSGNDMLEAMLDRSPEGRELPDVAPEGEARPSQRQMLLRGGKTWASHPVRAVKLTTELVRSAPAVATTNAASIPLVNRLVPSAGEGDVLGTGTGLRAPKVRFNAPITPHRRVAFTSVPLSGVKDIKKAAGSTVNDVVLALCSGALRRWLGDNDELPAEPLVAAVPVSVRTSAGKGELGNQVSMMIVSLPTDVDDPAERLRASSQASQVAKEKFGALPATALMDLYQFSFPALVNQAYRLAAKLRVIETARPFNVIISNVPGPPVPLFVAGAEMLEYYPVSALADGQGLNITVFSYRGQIFFGLLGCRELTPDLDSLAQAIDAEFSALQSAVAAGEGGAAQG